MFEEDEFIQDGKYRAYTAGMDKALKNFEYSSEWPDLISALGKLSKVISSHSKYKVIPRRLLVSKRLSQCLHPTLPSGVHLKALETYDLIFKCMGPDKLASELFIYAAGLFPLLNYAGISVRPSLLNIYETHLLGLQERLLPCLDGFLPAVLLGMEESSDFYQRTTDLLDRVKTGVGVDNFYTTLWRCVQSVPSARQPAINYMLGNKEEIVGEDLTLVLVSVQLCLVDTNILVQRASLELLATRDLGKGLDLVKAALRTLLRRDTSLNRRLYSWLAGSEEALVDAIQSLLCEDDEDNFRILVYLLDKSEVCELVLDKILVDVVRSLYIHGSVMVRSANLFFSTLHPNYIWEHLFSELCSSVECELSSRVQKPGSGRGSLPELCILLSFLLQLDSTLDKSYLAQLNVKVMELSVSGLERVSVENLHSLLTLLSSFPLSTMDWTQFTHLYVHFITHTLFTPQVDSVSMTFDLLLKRQLNLYGEKEFESGLTESLDLMVEKPEWSVPSLPTHPEALESLKLLHALLTKVSSVGLSESVTKTLLITATMAECEEVRVNGILTVVSLLPLIQETSPGLLTKTECVEWMTEFLWDRMPSPWSKSSLLSLYSLFPRSVERTLTTRVTTPTLPHVIHLLKHNLKLDVNFESVVLKCLEHLECGDAVKKTGSEGFVTEFMSSVGVVLDPLLRLFQLNFQGMESVLTFEEKERVERRGRKRALLPLPPIYPFQPIHLHLHPSPTEDPDTDTDTGQGVTMSGERESERETSGESTSRVDGPCSHPQHSQTQIQDQDLANSRKPHLFVDPCGRIIATKGIGGGVGGGVESDSEFEDVERESEGLGLGLGLAGGDSSKGGGPSISMSMSSDTDTHIIESDYDYEDSLERRLHPSLPSLPSLNPQSLSNPNQESMSDEEERERESESVSGNVFGGTESEVELQAQFNQVLDKLDMDLEESLGPLGLSGLGLEEETEEGEESFEDKDYKEDKDTTLLANTSTSVPEILTPQEEEGETETEPTFTLSPSMSQSQLSATNSPLPPLPHDKEDKDRDKDQSTQSQSQTEPHTRERETETERKEVQGRKHKLFSIHPYNTHLLIYTKRPRPDHGRVLYALSLLKSVGGVNMRAFLIAVSTTVSTHSRTTYLEIILNDLLRLSQGFYTEEEGEEGTVGVEEGDGGVNLTIHVEALRLIAHFLTGLRDLINSKGFGNFIGDMFSKIRLQKTILYSLASLVMMKSDEELTSTERILKLNYEKDFDIIYGEILRVTTSLVAIERELGVHERVKVPPSNKYIPNVVMCRQPLYLESLLKTLTNAHLSSCHKPTLTAILNSMPFYSGETGRIVSGVVECVCGSLKGAQDQEYVSRILDTLTQILHYVLLEQSTTEKVQQQTSTHILYNLVAVFLPVSGGNKEKEGSSPTSEGRRVSAAKGELLSLLPHLLSTLLTMWRPGIEHKILDLINPIAFNHVTHFIHSIGKQSDQVHVCVDLVLAMKVIILENLVSGIITSLKTSDDESHQLTLLHFLSSYMDKCKSLTDIWHLLIGLIKDGPTLPPRAQLVIFEICYKLAASGIPTVKTDLKELQETTYKLIESVSSHSSTEKKHKKEQSVQLEVVECLTVYLGGLVDMVWGSEDKVLPLITSVIYYVIPHVKFRYPYTHYAKTVDLICNLSSYSYLRKAWKKDVFEVLLEQNFFTFTKESMSAWKTTMDNLFTQDKYTFTELLGRVSVPQTGSLNIFSSKEIEYESRAMLLKRLAFVIFSSKKDQYVKFITNIQERLAEAIKMPTMIPNIQAQVFLCFRVLLLRLSPQHLNALWPIILHEILLVLIQMETDILTQNPSWLHLYLQLCKLLELALNLPPSQLPMFHMYRWSFTGVGTHSFTPHLTRLAEQLEATKSSNGIKPLRSNKIESLGELWEFLRNCEESRAEIGVFETVLQNDFLE